MSNATDTYERIMSGFADLLGRLRGIDDAKKKTVTSRGTKYPPGKQLTCFNGSQNRRDRKKRPITLPERA
jgi:hypothetical protein